MGITPIANLTELPLPQAVAPDLELPPMARVENSARTGDETYSPSKGKSARGSEDNESEDSESEDSESEDDFDDLPDETEAESAAPPAENNLARQISFFA